MCMSNVKVYETILTKEASEIFEKFKTSGEDAAFYFGKIARGEISNPNIATILQYAQVFANPDYRGRVGSPKSYVSQNISVVAGALNGEIKGLINNGFTSAIVIDKTLGLSDLRESYASTGKLPFYKLTLDADFSEIEEKLKKVAQCTLVETKKGLLKKTVLEPMKLEFVRSSNRICDLSKEIYQVAIKKINAAFETEMEKVTSAIFATLLVSRALNLSIGDKDNGAEKKLDEALKLQFYSHLNACSNNKKCAISKIIKTGAYVACSMIDEIGYSEDEIIEKYERLGTPIMGKPQNIFDALFGQKNIEHSIDTFVDEEIKYPDLILNSNESNKLIAGAGQVKNEDVIILGERTLSGDGVIFMGDGKTNQDIAAAIASATTGNVVTLNPGEKIAKPDEKIVNSDSVVYNKPKTAVNYSTMKRTLVKRASEAFDKECSSCINRAAKQASSGAINEANFWSGAVDGVDGKAPKYKTDFYSEGHRLGRFALDVIVKYLDSVYTEKDGVKVLKNEVAGKGSAATSEVLDQISSEMGENFDEWLKNDIITPAKNQNSRIIDAEKK